jgi:hypothetical protein
VKSDSSFEEIYFNSFSKATALGYESRRDNKVSVPISKLIKLSEEIGSLMKKHSGKVFRFRQALAVKKISFK